MEILIPGTEFDVYSLQDLLTRTSTTVGSRLIEY